MVGKVFKAVIIDDEQDSIELLSLLLREECPEINVIAKCHGAEEGIRAIQNLSPDVVFLDIVMPEMTGLQLVQRIGTASFYPVFTTAYSQYAINAIKLGAFDYLLKPIRRDELRLLMSRLLAIDIQKENRLSAEALISMMANIVPGPTQKTKITIQEGDQYHFLHLHEITYLQAEGNYTRFKLTDGKGLLVAKTLGHFCDLLELYGFFRTHASYLVNLSTVNTYIKGGNSRIIMKNGDNIPVAKTRKELFLSKM